MNNSTSLCFVLNKEADQGLGALLQKTFDFSLKICAESIKNLFSSILPSRIFRSCILATIVLAILGYTIASLKQAKKPKLSTSSINSCSSSYTKPNGFHFISFWLIPLMILTNIGIAPTINYILISIILCIIGQVSMTVLIPCDYDNHEGIYYKTDGLIIEYDDKEGFFNYLKEIVKAEKLIAEKQYQEKWKEYLK